MDNPPACFRSVSLPPRFQGACGGTILDAADCKCRGAADIPVGIIEGGHERRHGGTIVDGSKRPNALPANPCIAELQSSGEPGHGGGIFEITQYICYRFAKIVVTTRQGGQQGRNYGFVMDLLNLVYRSLRHDVFVFLLAVKKGIGSPSAQAFLAALARERRKK